MASSSAAPAPPRPLLTPKPDPDAPPMVDLTPELCAALRRELEPSPDDQPEFVHGLRLAQDRLDAISANLVSTATATPPVPPRTATKRPAVEPEASTSTGAKGKRRARGAGAAEMVRATVPAGPDHVHARNLVRRARLTFEALRVVYHRGDAGAGARKRADLSALSTMLDRGLGLYRDVRIVGPIPGVFVGDVFTYRAELCVVGLHNHVQRGIGYIPASIVSDGKPVATSIVSSGGYLDDHDGGDVLVYTGSGGRPRNGGDHFADQKLEGGNLSLVYSCEYGIEVRVVRSHDCEASPSGKVYVYDGLYKVESSTYGPGKSGPDVCKFKLVRIPGQDELGSSIWHAAGELRNALASRIRPRGYLTLDLSKGKERLRVPVCNKVDQDSSPLDFEYIAHPDFPASRVPRPVKRYKACHCGTTCGAGRSPSAAACKCVCVRKNGGGLVYNADGTLIRGRPVVYECGALCGCPAASCLNRATQGGMEHRLEVFRSKETEWGVRTLELIQPGAFVCEYSGDVVTVDDSQSTDWGSFVDPRKFPARWREWGDASAALPEKEGHKFPELITGPGYVLDVSRRRNFAAYISHSSAPNVFVQFVIRGNEDESCPHLMVFAMDTIPPMRELSIDYGIDQQG